MDLEQRGAGWVMRAWLGAILFVLVTAFSAPASGEDLSIRQFRHSRWTADGTTPGHINRILQTRDGYLWIVGGDGLSRFDGVVFETFSPADRNPRAAYSVQAIMETRAGELWTGLSGDKAVATFRDGHFIDMAMPNPAQSVIAMAEDLDGAVWVVNARTVNGLSRFANGRWDEPGPSLGLPGGWIFSILVARDGALWLGMMDKAIVLRRGARRFEIVDAQVKGGAALAEDSAGRIWLADRAGIRRLPQSFVARSAPGPVIPYPAGTIVRRTRLAFSQDGALWVTTGSSGVFRIPHPEAGAMQPAFGEADGLTDNQTSAVFSDREGTVWVGGLRGLNAFVRPSLIGETAIPAGATEYNVTTDKGGSVYVGEDGDLFMIRPGARPQMVKRGLSPGFGLCASQGGGVWVIDGGKAEEIVDGRPTRAFAADAGSGNPLCAEDAGRTLWLGSGEGTLLAHDRNGWRDEGRRLAGGFVDSLSVDRQGRLLVGNSFLSVMRLENGRTRSWSTDDLGLYQLSFARDGALGLVVAGSGGLARIRDGRIERLSTRVHPWLRKMRWIIETPEGDVWLFTATNIIRFRLADLEQAFRHPERPIPRRTFDSLDGLTSGADRIVGARAARGGDSRLWFLGVGGVMRLNPRSMERNVLEPPVAIRSVKSGNVPVPVADTISLPVGASTLQIDYTALSLRTPSRVRFRYRLVGIDDAWVEAGDRRSAYYNSLKPGNYRFEVIAANDDGVWNRTGAAMAISIPPMFWQTSWFLAVCLAAAGVATWFLYRIRLHAVTDRIRSGLGERLAERERIARELHDTLLQGVQGLILRFQLIAEELPRDRPQRASMEAALDEADEVLGQARDRVQDLRMTDLEEGNLEAALANLAAGGGGSPAVGVFIDGAARPLERIAGDELTQIVSEALSNARRHANAGCIEIRVRYGRSLEVSVVDDGEGMSPEILRDGRAGHFGLTGMRERARRIQARIKLDSTPFGGTRIVITMPGRVAYARKPGETLMDRLRGLIGG
jgi:ligand-binding sensor domain-containing protein/signal transduction histidine kinase